MPNFRVEFKIYLSPSNDQENKINENTLGFSVHEFRVIEHIVNIPKIGISGLRDCDVIAVQYLRSLSPMRCLLAQVHITLASLPALSGNIPQQPAEGRHSISIIFLITA